MSPSRLAGGILAMTILAWVAHLPRVLGARIRGRNDYLSFSGNPKLSLPLLLGFGDVKNP